MSVMGLKLLSTDQLEGVCEKLKRADESIQKLNIEIDDFLVKDGLASSITTYDEDAFQELVKFHSGAKIPPRFSVMAGEIIHHLRSSLNYIAWLLSSRQYRAGKKTETRIEFPIYPIEPTKIEELSRYQGKVDGIISPDAKTRIKELQPYQGPEPMDDPLFIVHEFDRIDKHHELVLVVASYMITAQTIPAQRYANPILVGNVYVPGWSYQQMKMNTQITTLIAFRDFGKRKNQPIIPSLTQLTDVVRDVIGMFA
jgi:hypothetical protein